MQRVNKVVEYINQHLESSLDIKTLAEISCFSRFHFHKIMRAFLKEPLYGYISRIRLETAARYLRYSQLSVQEIAYKTGYEVPSSLSKAFKQAFGISPAEYRQNKEFTIKRKALIDDNLKLKRPVIKELPTRKVIYTRLWGNYSTNDYDTAWTQLWNYVKANKLFSAGIENIGISYDDPKVTDAENCRYEACLVIHKEPVPSSHIGVKDLEGGSFAVFLYQGPYHQLSVVYDTIFSRWLLQSGYELRESPIIEKYLNNPNRTIESKLKTEIYIPIK